MTTRPSIESLLVCVDALYHDEALGYNKAQDFRDALEELESLRAENEALKAVNDRLRQDRLDYSAVTTTEGLNASEWIWRTGKAERERDAERARADALGARVEALESWYDDHTERECAICPEDVSCTEYIDLLLDTVEASTAKNDALAASLGRVWALATHDSECDSRVGGKCNCPYYSTPAADLEAHDAKVREPLEKRIAELEAEKADRLWKPLGDNHHNAAACPYCNPEREAHDARVRREALRAGVASLRRRGFRVSPEEEENFITDAILGDPQPRAGEGA